MVKKNAPENIHEALTVTPLGDYTGNLTRCIPAFILHR